MIRIAALLLLSSILASCIEAPPKPPAKEPIPWMTYIDPKNPSTRVRRLKRSCMLYMDQDNSNQIGWVRMGEDLITQRAEETEYMLRVFSMWDYETGYVNKDCF